MAQAWVQELRDEPDPHRRVLILAANGRAILERRHAIDEVVRSAAASDPDIAALHETGKAQRFAGQRELHADRGRHAPASVRASTSTPRRTSSTRVGSPETYRLLVIDRGWTGDRFERWYADTIERLLA